MATTDQDRRVLAPDDPDREPRTRTTEVSACPCNHKRRSRPSRTPASVPLRKRRRRRTTGPEILCCEFEKSWGAHAPSRLRDDEAAPAAQARVPVGASPTDSASAQRTGCCRHLAQDCGEAPQAAREARAVPGKTSEVFGLVQRDEEFSLNQVHASGVTSPSCSAPRV